MQLSKLRNAAAAAAAAAAAYGLWNYGSCKREPFSAQERRADAQSEVPS